MRIRVRTFVITGAAMALSGAALLVAFACGIARFGFDPIRVTALAHSAVLLVLGLLFVRKAGSLRRSAAAERLDPRDVRGPRVRVPHDGDAAASAAKPGALQAALVIFGVFSAVGALSSAAARSRAASDRVFDYPAHVSHYQAVGLAVASLLAWSIVLRRVSGRRRKVVAWIMMLNVLVVACRWDSVPRVLDMLASLVR